MRVGQVERHWSHNCLALGLSGGFIEPLEATALHLVQVGIEAFSRKFDLDGCSPMARASTTGSWRTVERVRDYIVAHYRLNTRKARPTRTTRQRPVSNLLRTS